MKRREFIAGLGSAAAWPVVARAQQPAMPVIGFLSGRPLAMPTGSSPSFRPGLEGNRLCRGPERGDRISLGGRPKRSAAGARGRSCPPSRSRDRRRPATPAALAAKRDHDDTDRLRQLAATRSKLGLVASLNRPGGNVTGVSHFRTRDWRRSGWNCSCKLLPKLTRCRRSGSPARASGSEAISPDLQAAAPTLGLASSVVVNARTTANSNAAFATLSQQRVGCGPDRVNRHSSLPARVKSSPGGPPCDCPRSIRRVSIAVGRRPDELWHRLR